MPINYEQFNSDVSFPAIQVREDLWLDGGLLKIDLTDTNATGDILYRGSDGYIKRLGIGSAGQVLGISGGTPAWVAGGTSGTPGDGSYILPIASESLLGGIKVGNTLTIDETGILQAKQYSLPKATANIIGGIRIGNGLSIDADGIVSSSGASAPATEVVFGTGAGILSSPRVTYDGLTFKLANNGTTASVFTIVGTAMTDKPLADWKAAASTNADTGKVFGVGVSGENFHRGMFYSDGSFWMGGGNAQRDTVVSRPEANTVRISSNRTTGAGHLQVIGNASANQVIVATGLTLNYAAGTSIYNSVGGVGHSFANNGVVVFDAGNGLTNKSYQDFKIGENIFGYAANKAPDASLTNRLAFGHSGTYGWVQSYDNTLPLALNPNSPSGVVIGDTTTTGAKLAVSGNVNALGGLARSVNLNGGLTAVAINDKLVGLHLGFTFTNSGNLAGVTNYALEAPAGRILFGTTAGANMLYDNSKLNIVTPAVAGTREVLFSAKMTDDNSSVLQIGNGTSVDGRFAPALVGYASNSVNSGIMFRGLSSTASDTGTAPMVEFQAARTNNASNPNDGTLSSIVTRPLFLFSNQSDPVLKIFADRSIMAYGLAGTGDRMVVADSTGVLKTQAIPQGGGSGFVVNTPLNNRIITATDTSSEANAEANLTYDNTTNYLQNLGIISSIAGNGANGFVLGDYANGTGTFSMKAITGRNLTFNDETAGAERIRVDVNGRVGIANTNPQAQLVIGSSVSKTLEFNGFNPTFNGGTIEVIDRSGSNAQVDLSYFLGIGGNHKFYTSGAERMRVDFQGKVGIGYTTPEEKLHVNGNIVLGDYSAPTNFGLVFRTAKAVFSITTDGVTDAGGTTLGYSWSNGGQGPLRFNNAGGTVMLLTDDGKLGVGTTNVTERLTVNGNIALGAIGETFIYNSGAGPSTAAAIGGAYYIKLRTYVGSAWIDRMHISQNGYVGIGTGEPTQLLDVRGGNIRLGNDAAPFYIGKGVDLVGSTDVSDLALRTESGAIIFATSAGVERMRIQADGRIGINNSNPTSKLSITDGTGTLLLDGGTINSTRSDGLFLQNTNALRLWVNGSDRLYINSSGQVGIGTISFTDTNDNVLRLKIDNGKLRVTDLGGAGEAPVYATSQGVLYRGTNQQGTGWIDTGDIATANSAATLFSIQVPIYEAGNIELTVTAIGADGVSSRHLRYEINYSRGGNGLFQIATINSVGVSSGSLAIPTISLTLNGSTLGVFINTYGPAMFRGKYLVNRVSYPLS